MKRGLASLADAAAIDDVCVRQRTEDLGSLDQGPLRALTQLDVLIWGFHQSCC